MNIVSIDAVGGMLPLAVSLFYLPRTVRSLGWFYDGVFALSMLISTYFSYCESNAVTSPRARYCCAWFFGYRGRGRNLDVPASAIFTVAFIAGFPVDVYLGYVCHAGEESAVPAYRMASTAGAILLHHGVPPNAAHDAGGSGLR